LPVLVGPSMATRFCPARPTGPGAWGLCPRKPRSIRLSRSQNSRRTLPHCPGSDPKGRARRVNASDAKIAISQGPSRRFRRIRIRMVQRGKRFRRSRARPGKGSHKPGTNRVRIINDAIAPRLFPQRIDLGPAQDRENDLMGARMNRPQRIKVLHEDRTDPARITFRRISHRSKIRFISEGCERKTRSPPILRIRKRLSLGAAVRLVALTLP